MTNRNPHANIGHTRPAHSKLFPAAVGQNNNDCESARETQAPQLLVPSEHKSNALNFTHLFRRSPVISVLAQVDDWTLAWGGRISCTLKLSIGNITVHTNRDLLPIEIDNGSWVRAKLFLARSAQGHDRLLNAMPMFPARNDATTSWLPIAAYVRNDHMRRLRTLLSQLEPAMQAIFMGAMSDIRVQQGFFRRVSAADHHGYPGGLFDHSVEAAEIAWAQSHLTVRERGIAVLVCLLFDLGKTGDEWLRPDAERVLDGLAPHPLSQSLLKQPLVVVEHLDPDLVKQVRTLMQGFEWSEMLVGPGKAPTLQQCIYQSIVRSWLLDGGIDSCVQKGQA